ncbi:MAG: N-acetylmuramidase domain-containing protein [Albidovulum sp.]
MALFDRDAQARISTLANDLGVESAALLAVAEVESAGKPFMADGVTPRFLFEAHHFWNHLGPGSQRDRAAREGLARAKWNRAEQYKTQGTDAGKMRTLAQARAIDEEAANKSCSWGVGQVMGDHAVSLGYPSATAMVEAMQGDVAAQVDVMARFIRKNRAMLADLKAKRWAGFARAYNGPGYKQNRYDEKMAAAYQRWARTARPQRVVSAPVEDAPDHITDRHQVSLVQTWLRNLGYTEIGTPDGKIGTYTEGAVSAYRTAKGLPPGKHIDDELILTLAKDTEPRVIAPERANADSARVQEVAPEARPTWCAKVWSGVTALGAGIVALGQGVVSHIQPAREYIQPVQDMLSDVPSWVWLAAVAGIAFYIWKSTRKAEAAITEAVQTGARR